MNPARSFGRAAVTGVYKNLWVYIVAPVLRAIAATALYNVLRVPEPVKSDPKDNTSTSMKFNRSLANTKMSKDYPGLAKQNGKWFLIHSSRKLEVGAHSPTSRTLIPASAQEFNSRSLSLSTGLACPFLNKENNNK